MNLNLSGAINVQNGNISIDGNQDGDSSNVDISSGQLNVDELVNALLAEGYSQQEIEENLGSILAGINEISGIELTGVEGYQAFISDDLQIPYAGSEHLTGGLTIDASDVTKTDATLEEIRGQLGTSAANDDFGISGIQDQISGLADQITSLQDQIANVENQINVEIPNQISELNNEIAMLQDVITQLNTDITNLTVNMAELQKMIAQLQDDYKDLVARMEFAQEMRAKINEQLDVINQQIELWQQGNPYAPDIDSREFANYLRDDLHMGRHHHPFGFSHHNNPRSIFETKAGGPATIEEAYDMFIASYCTEAPGGLPFEGGLGENGLLPEFFGTEVAGLAAAEAMLGRGYPNTDGYPDIGENTPTGDIDAWALQFAVFVKQYMPTGNAKTNPALMLEALEAFRDGLEGMLASVDAEISNIQFQMDQVTAKIDECQAKIEECGDKIEECQAKIKECQDKIKECQEKIKELKAQMEELKQQLQDMRKQLKELNEQMAKLQEDLAQAQAEKSKVMAEQSEMQAKMMEEQGKGGDDSLQSEKPATYNVGDLLKNQQLRSGSFKG